ncbi:MAG: TM2 domain-containing protein [Bacteroidales bacterium]|nr:TM2 domain-containing protein [Bacteroidales bacterium]
MKPISKTTASILSFFFGIFGIHRLRMGYKNWWLMPMTLGGFLIWHLFDFLKIMTGKMTMADGTPLSE